MEGKQILKKKVIFSFFLAIDLLSAGNVSLKQLCENGIKYHPKVKSYQFDYSSKHYSYKQQVDQFFPQLSISADTGHENYKYEYPTKTIKNSYNHYEYSLILRQEVYNPVLFRKIKDASLREKVSGVQYRDSQAQLVTKIVQTYIELIRIVKHRNLSKKKTRLYKKAYDQIKEKYKMKFSNVSEVAQARSKWMESRAETATYRQQYFYVLNTLKYLTNKKKIPNELKERSFNIKHLNKYLTKKNIHNLEKLLSKNTRVELYKIYKNIAQNLIEIKKAGHYPRVGIEASYTDGNYGDKIEPKNDSKITLNISLPLYEGGYISDQVDEARLLYYKADQDLRNSILESKISFEQNIVQLKEGYNTLQVLRESVKSSKIYFETTLNAYKSGLKDLTDVYLSNIDYYKTIGDRIDQEAQILSTIISLYYLTGISTPSTIGIFEKKFLKR